MTKFCLIFAFWSLGGLGAVAGSGTGATKAILNQKATGGRSWRDLQSTNVVELSCAPLAERRDAASLRRTFSGQQRLRLEISPKDKVCTLVEIIPAPTGLREDEFIRPVARSYDERDWETSSGPYAGLVQFECPDNADGTDATHCTTTLPAFEGRRRFQLTSLNGPSYSNRDVIARFLEQTTFGPTNRDINAINQRIQDTGKFRYQVFQDWVQDQMNANVVPMTSHRAWYRTRLNARYEFPSALGAVSHPCQEGTRYRRYTFTNKDIGKTVTVISIANGRLGLMVDGFVRTHVRGPIQAEEPSRRGETLTFTAGNSYMICEVENTVSGYMEWDHPDDRGCQAVIFAAGTPQQSMYNPPVNFSPPPQEPVVSLGVTAAQPVDSVYFTGTVPPTQELLLTRSLTQSVCGTIQPTGIPPTLIFGRYRGDYYIHDSRFTTLDNTLESPLADGGGTIVASHRNVQRPTLSAMCSNVPRSFLNQDSCFMSTDPNVCAARLADDDDEGPEYNLQLNETTLRTFFTQGNRYVYAVDGLRIADDDRVGGSCQPLARSRWVKVRSCNRNGEHNIRARTRNTFRDAFDATVASDLEKGIPIDSNIRDIVLPLDARCHPQDMGEKGYRFRDNNRTCWLNVHPDHLNVYDFTPWTIDHPGNTRTFNPIMNFATRQRTTILSFPQSHELVRWYDNRGRFAKLGRMGDTLNYYTVPLETRSSELDRAVGFTASLSGSSTATTSSDNPLVAVSTGVGPNDVGSVVCGSPNEVSNDLSLGGSQRRGAFDAVTPFAKSTQDGEFNHQKRIIWTEIALNAPDQLRQRVAWALAQILVVSQDALPDGEVLTEMLMAYYDIFVRNAFGSYFDILREVSYSPVMANMLTFLGSRSTAYVWENEGNLEYADENYAREVMQLFSNGLVQLNMDGTEILDDNGSPKLVYTNDDIVEYARVWTGFVYQEQRGNMEEGPEGSNLIDPMRIEVDFRDRFPKMGLNRQYIGDGYPLCADLPQRHFLRKGAKYRLLGSSSTPQLQEDPSVWSSFGNTKRVVLQRGNSNSLFAQLCGSTNANNCNRAATVILDSTVPCRGQECNVDTLRVVQVANGLYYEYVREPCVHHAFYENGRLLARYEGSGNLICSNPRSTSASPTCCNTNTIHPLQYFGERTLFSTANTRCNSNLCNVGTLPNCDENDGAIGLVCADNSYRWTRRSCSVQAKIDPRGNVAIVHSGGASNSDFARLVQEDTKTFFRVDWDGDYEGLIRDCTSVNGCSRTSDGFCLCDVTVNNEQAFTSSPQRWQVRQRLDIGALDPVVIGGLSMMGEENGVTTYSKDGTMSIDSVFVFEDSNRILQRRKNMRSVVRIAGRRNVSFRNPVHFIDLADPELRDAQYETDAALEHYFYHPNTPPFLAIRFAQRFGISNPSPRYVRSAAWAFRNGRWSTGDITFGTGNYGDLSAMIGAILLNREARETTLDADPAHGSLKEPLIKLIGLMRAMEFELFDAVPFVDFGMSIGDRIGQMAHEIPNVFSFFMPEHQPSGRISQADLVSPEAQVLTTPTIVDTLNGMFALIKFGLGNLCWGGFGGFGPADERELKRNRLCRRMRVGQFDTSVGRLTFTPSDSSSEQNVVRELATLLTAGRLSRQSRRVIEGVYARESNKTMALFQAQQLIASTPEFHTTSSTIRKANRRRPERTPPPPSNKPYKAVVYVLLRGGYDSWNTLVPHTCEQGNQENVNLLDQYNAIRSGLALSGDERFRTIDASNQPCSQFVIHPNLEIAETLYKDKDLAFFANAGVINQPVTKDNFRRNTETQLFAHNTMQEEARRIDPFDGSPGTGVLGRTVDVLLDKGFNAKPITINDATVATIGVPGESVDPLIVSAQGTDQFNPRHRTDRFNPRRFIDRLNNATQQHSNMFGETWSNSLFNALEDNDALLNALENNQLTQEFQNNKHSRNMRAVASVIASREDRGTDRDVIYVSMRSWDHHRAMKRNLAESHTDLNNAFTSFVAEMKNRSLWENVTVVVTSDFGRTLTGNSGDGSDHAWGGHYFMFGGSVKGGQILGDFPTDITESGALNIGRGRIIPTLSWESILNGVVGWLGVETEMELDYCLPNRRRTGTTLFSASQLFDSKDAAPAAPLFCFPGDATVHVESKGEIKMRELEIGDSVMGERGIYSEVYAFAHKQKYLDADFVKIRTKAQVVELSRAHMLSVKDKGMIAAGLVKLGDTLQLGNGEDAVVEKINMVKRKGIFAPLTMSGTIVVNDIVTSNYVTLQTNNSKLAIGGVELFSYHWLMHMYQAPHRVFCSIVGCSDSEASYTSSGVAGWAHLPFEVMKWVLRQSEWTKFVAFVPILTLVLLIASCHFVGSAPMIACFVLFVAAAVYRLGRRNKKVQLHY